MNIVTTEGRMNIIDLCLYVILPLRWVTIVSNGGFLGNSIIEGIYGASDLVCDKNVFF